MWYQNKEARLSIAFISLLSCVLFIVGIMSIRIVNTNLQNGYLDDTDFTSYSEVKRTLFTSNDGMVSFMYPETWEVFTATKKDIPAQFSSAKEIVIFNDDAIPLLQFYIADANDESFKDLVNCHLVIELCEVQVINGHSFTRIGLTKLVFPVSGIYTIINDTLYLLIGTQNILDSEINRIVESAVVNS